MSLKVRSTEKIVGHKKFIALDKDLYNFLVNYAVKNLRTATKSKKQLHEIVPDIDYFSWRLEDREIYSVNCKVYAEEILHQSVHNIIGDCFKYPRLGYPKMSLLNEAIGAGTAFYWTILDTASGKNSFWLGTYIKNGRKIKLDVLKMVNYALVNPQIGYKRVVNDTYRLFYSLLVELEKTKNTPESFYTYFELKLKEYPWAIFYTQFSLVIPTYFAFYFSGLKSNRRDTQMSRNCLTAFNNAESLLSFLHGCVERAK